MSLTVSLAQALPLVESGWYPLSKYSTLLQAGTITLGACPKMKDTAGLHKVVLALVDFRPLQYVQYSLEMFTVGK